MKRALVFGVFFAAGIAVPAEAKQWKGIDITNESLQAIQMVELEDATRRFSSLFWLGETKIPPGGGGALSPIEIQEVEGLCLYHVTITFDDGRQLVFLNQDLCEFPRIKAKMPTPPPPPY